MEGYIVPAAFLSRKKEGEMIKEVVVMGAGGVGFWLAVALARDENLKDIHVHVFDDDTVEGSGGRRLPYAAREDVHKVHLLNAFTGLTMRDQGLTLHVSKAYLHSLQNWHAESDILVVDCTDMSGMARGRYKQMCDENPRFRYLRVSYDGNGWFVISRGLPFEQDGAVGGYDRVPTMAQSFAAAGAGAAAVSRVIRGEIVADYQVNVNTGECLSTWGSQ